MAKNVKFSTGLQEDLLKRNSDNTYVHKIEEGHVYFTTRENDEGETVGSIYYDINGKRVSMGGGIAEQAQSDDRGQNIADTYVTRISSEGTKYASTDGVTLTTYNGRNAALDTIMLPVASADRAGVIITGAQTFAGNKTFSGIVHLSNTRDADGSTDSGVLIIGDKNGEHLILDGNEIIAKNTTSKIGTLYLNNNGGIVQIGGNLLPSGNKTLDFGSASNYWKNGYIANLVTDTLSGHLTGTLTGNVTGNVTGHASLDLPLAGGTMTGDITFATISSWPTVSGETYPIKSKGLKWNGSSDNASIYYQVDGSDSGHLYLDTGDDVGASVKFSNKGVAHTVMSGDGKLYPATNNSGSIGTSSNKFAAIYATNFYGIIEKAYADESGNNIKASYAASLQNHAHDGNGWSFRLLNKNGGALTAALTIPGATTSAAGLVTTGEQTFAGKKTFNGQVVIANTTDAVKGTANSGSLIVGTATGSHIVIDPDEIMAKSNGTSAGTLHLQYEGGTIVSGGNFNPKATDSLALGTQDLAWKEAHINEIYGHLNGSLTGPVSGNASTASKWLTARTLTIGSTGKKVDGSADVSWSRAEIGISKSYSSFKTASTKTDGWYTIATIGDSNTTPALFFVKAYAHSSMIFTVTKGYSTNGGINILDFNNSRNDGYAYVLGARLLSDGKVQIKIHTKTSAGANTSVNVTVNAFNSSDTLTLSSELVADDSSPTVIQTREPANATAIMMANTFYGNLSGTASHATNDTSGAAILSKYLTRIAFVQANNSDSDTTKKLNLQVYDGNNALKATVQVPNASATEAGVVNTGTQTFAGNKTFTGRIHFSNTTDAAKGSDSGVITIGNKSGEHMLIDQNEIMVKANATTSAVLHLQAEGGQTEIGGAFIPKGNKAHNLGGESNYWKNAYISNVVTDTLSGHLTGSLTGPVTGNVTGNLTGNVTGHASEDLALKDLNTYVVTKSSLGACSDYERCVIALCETTAANTPCSSHWKGSIYRQRDNGLVPMYVAEVAFQGAYSGPSQVNYSLFSNSENTSTAATTGEGYRACIFTYNGKTYAGVEFAQTQAANFYLTGNGNFKPFLVKYYNSNTKAVLNSEINTSLKYGSSVGVRQEYYLVGTVTKAIGDESGNNIKTSYLASIQQVTSDKDTFTFRGYNKNNQVMNNLITIPAATASDSDSTKWKAGLVTSQAQTWAGNKTFRGDITIQHPTVNTMGTASTNPYLRFLNTDGSQGAYIMFTDYDSYRAPGGLKIFGIGSVPAWLEVEGQLIVGGASTLKGTVTITGNIMPSADNTYVIGDLNAKWKDIYSTTAHVYNTLYVNTSTTGTVGGITLHGTVDPTVYGIAMRSNLGAHAYATDTWNTYFSMANGATRGWVFRNGTTNVASINGQGYAQFNKLSLNRVGGTANGRISWYSPTYYTWYDYMSDSSAGAAPTGGQPSQMGSVTSWAQRSLIENVANYGWIWESASNAAASATTTQPTPRMALAADTGRLYLSNDLMIMMGDTDKFVHYLYANGAGATNYVGASWRAGVLGSGSSNTNYYVIQSGTSSTASTTWENAVRIGQNNYDFTVGTTNKGGIGVANTNSTTGNGISLYNGAIAGDGSAKSGKPTYGLFFGGTGTFGTYGGVTGDWATYFTMNSTANRGWVFLKDTTPVFSINNNGLTKLGDGTGATASSSGSDTGALRVVGGISTTKNSYFHEKITFPENKIALEFSSRDTWKAGIVYDTSGHEAMVVALQNERSSFMVVQGTDPNAWTNGKWTSSVPVIQAKKGSLYVNALFNGDPAYNFYVNGTGYFESALDVMGIAKFKQGSAATGIHTGAVQITGGLSATAKSWFDAEVIIGQIRGKTVGSQTGEFIHMYDRVHIGSPSGWGSVGAPTYGLSTYGGAWLAVNQGNVGIGTSTPTASVRLHVQGGGGLAVIDDASNNTYDALAYFRTYSANDWGMIIDKNNSYDYGLNIKTLHTGTNALSVRGASRFTNTVRIGTTSTTFDGNYCEGIRIQAPASTWCTIAMGGTGDTGTGENCWSIHRKADNNFAISRNSSDGANGLVMTATGMGLGTTAPSYRLHVNGTTCIDGSLLRVNGAPIFGYRYSQSNNAPAFVFDKPGSNYTGIGANGEADTIYFGAVTSDGAWNWVTSYKQKWKFNGTIIADNLTCTSTVTLPGGYVKKREDGTSYTQLGSYYNSGSTAAYVRIALPVFSGWNMCMLECSIRQNYGSGQFGKLIIYAHTSGSASNWTQFYAVYHDRLTSAIKVYGSDNRYFYIAGLAAWGGLTVDKMVLGDAVTGADMSNVVIDGVSALPTTYQTASMLRSWVQGDSVTNAVWNDYAECREADTEEPGYVLVEKGDDTLTRATERLQPFAGIVSDTWGFSQGETDKAKTNIAVAGRVLAYTYQPRERYKPGDCVCAAPGGLVDIMTREEVIKYPDRIVGTVSYVPDYEEWGGGEKTDRDPVKVNGRIWIKIK